jgi:hypothetical protein
MEARANAVTWQAGASAKCNKKIIATRSIGQATPIFPAAFAQTASARCCSAKQLRHENSGPTMPGLLIHTTPHAQHHPAAAGKSRRGPIKKYNISYFHP